MLKQGYRIEEVQHPNDEVYQRWAVESLQERCSYSKVSSCALVMMDLTTMQLQATLAFVRSCQIMA